MKGTLMYSPNKENWIVEYKEGDRDVFLEVWPGRIDDLNRVGTHLQNLSTVDFKIENTDHFPYRFAVPYVESLDEDMKPRATSTIAKKKIKKLRITLWLSEFQTDEVDVECENYDCSNNGYWYFYNRDSSDRRIIIGCYPVDKTIIHSIENFEIEE